MKRGLAIAIVLLAVSAVATVACDDSEPRSTRVEPTVANLFPTSSPSEMVGEAAQTPTASAQSRDTFAALLIASQQATYRVRYDTSSESGERRDSYVVFNRPPSARVDTFTAGATNPSSQIIVGPDGSTFGCSFDNGNRRCSEIEAFSGPLPLTAGPILFPPASDIGSINVVELDSQTIAGVPVRCFRVLPAGEADDPAADYCFSAQAVPLYANGPTGIIMASELSSPSDADFALPTP